MTLSKLTNQLIEIYQRPDRPYGADMEHISVSRTISFLAVMLEKVRMAVEFHEDHLIRRAAIERILRRRLLLNENGRSLASPLIKELLWAGYLTNNTVPKTAVDEVQETIDKYMYIKSQIVHGRPGAEQRELNDFIIDMTSCEIEQKLSPSPKREAFTNFVYHILNRQVRLPDYADNDADIQLYIAVDRAFAKSDDPLIRFHLSHLYFPRLFNAKWKDTGADIPKMRSAFRDINVFLKDPIGVKLSKWVKKQMPPFLILRDIFEKEDVDELTPKLEKNESLHEVIDKTCRRRYDEIGKRLRRAGARSIIYIFLTKMLVALFLEYPYDKYIEQAVRWVPLTINVIFPPVLMFLVVGFTSTPGHDNTERIFDRIKNIITAEKFTGRPIVIKARIISDRPVLTLIFSIIYLLTFVVSFGLIIAGLSLLNFNLASQLIFIFFVSVVLFFAYRIRLTANEYRLSVRDGILTPITDFFLIPVLNLGRWLSDEVAKFGPLALFTLVFDIIIEAPFKAIFEVAEEWVVFARAKKEEIV